MKASEEAIIKELDKSGSEAEGMKGTTINASNTAPQDDKSIGNWVTQFMDDIIKNIAEISINQSKASKPEVSVPEEFDPEAQKNQEDENVTRENSLETVKVQEDKSPFFSSKNIGSKITEQVRTTDMNEVANLVPNIYSHGGGLATADIPGTLHSVNADLSMDCKAESRSVRKSSRSSKGINPRLGREDIVVDLPQMKANQQLNPNWLSNYDVETTPILTTPSKTATTLASIETVNSDTSEDQLPITVASGETPVQSCLAASKSSIELRASSECIDVNQRKFKSATSPLQEETLHFDPEKFTPGYVPKTVIKGGEEYAIVVSGVKDTGLCGGYWGNSENLGSRRRRKPTESLQCGRNGKPTILLDTDSKQMSEAGIKGDFKESSQLESIVDSEQNIKSRSRRRKNEDISSSARQKKLKSSKKVEKFNEDEEGEDYAWVNGDSLFEDKRSKDGLMTGGRSSAVAAALAAGVPAGQQRSVSCVTDDNSQREVVVECFAPYDENRWVNIGKERDGMAPDAVQYSRALKPPYHLLSFLRIKGHSTKGMSCTDKNTMVFLVLVGELTVILHTTKFNVKKGDSFYIPPKNYYNIINEKAMEAELSLTQFQYDGPLPTVHPNSE